MTRMPRMHYHRRGIIDYEIEYEMASLSEHSISVSPLLYVMLKTNKALLQCCSCFTFCSFDINRTFTRTLLVQ